MNLWIVVGMSSLPQFHLLYWLTNQILHYSVQIVRKG